MPYDGYYQSGSEEVECQIKRMGTNNSRIILAGEEKLVPTELVRRADEPSENLNGLILPFVPLERLYRKFRKDTGSKQAKFEAIKQALEGRHGARHVEFLAELFRRSVCHAAFYENLNESFHPERSTASTASNYAKQLVCMFDEAKTVPLGSTNVTMIDYEVFPFRTTSSCTEVGSSARSTAGGGMDLLLKSGEGFPTIGEIKASTEQVGPTFALVQSLMYASQIATVNQFRRLQRHYEDFGELSSGNIVVEILVILEAATDCLADDLEYALHLGRALQDELTQTIHSINFVETRQMDSGLTFQLLE